MEIAHLAAHPRHIATLSDLCGREWAHLYPGYGPQRARAEFLAARDDGELPATLIVLEGTELLGTVSLIHDDLPGREDLNPWLASLFVLPGQRGKGVASFLIREAEMFLRAHGVSAAYLFTEAAGPLFARHGWVEFDAGLANGHAVTIFRKAL